MKISKPFRVPSLDLSTIEIDKIGQYCQAPKIHPDPLLIPHYFERVEIMTSGRGWIQEKDEWREVLPGDLIWNKPGDYTIGKSDFSNPYQCFVVILKTNKRDGLGLPRFSRWPEIPAIKAFAQELLGVFVKKSNNREVLRNYILGRLLFQVDQHQAESVNTQMPPALQVVLQHLNQNFKSSCKMKELAELSGWSVAHLHDIFREHLQTTPRQWLIQRRLQAAREMLISSLRSMKEVASQCGFTDTAAFSNVFKIENGLSPSKFRKNHWKPI